MTIPITDQFVPSDEAHGFPLIDPQDILGGKTGTGAVVLATSPTLVTPILGVAAATSINKIVLTAPATAATLTLIEGTVLTGPAASGTAMTLGNAETITGVKTFDTTTKLQFTDATAFIHATSAGNLLVEAATLLSLGKTGAEGAHNFELTDGVHVVVGSSLGTMLGTATSQKLGAYGTTPIARTSLTGFTLTYSTATHTHSAMTSAAVTGTADATYSTNEVTLINDLVTAVNALRNDAINAKQVLNGAIGDLKLIGWLY